VDGLPHAESGESADYRRDRQVVGADGIYEERMFRMLDGDGHQEAQCDVYNVVAAVEHVLGVKHRNVGVHQRPAANEEAHKLL
jgi:hypothetical protein